MMSRHIIKESLSTTTPNISTLVAVFRIRKRFSINGRYMYNSDQSDCNLLANDTQAEIVIELIIDLDLVDRQSDTVMQPAKQSLKQPSYYADVSFGYSSLLN